MLLVASTDGAFRREDACDELSLRKVPSRFNSVLVKLATRRRVYGEIESDLQAHEAFPHPVAFHVEKLPSAHLFPVLSL